MTADLDEWLEQGSRPEAQVPICLVGDLAARYQVKVEEALRAASDPNRSLEDPAAALIAAELDELQQQMEGRTRVFTLRALDPDVYLEIQVASPPREGNEIDQRLGYNRDTFLPALVKASIVEPDLSDAQFTALRSKVSSRQWDELWVTAQQLNREDVRAPKSLGISEQMPTSAAKSRRPAGSGSPSSVSGAGPRKRSGGTRKAK